MIDTKLRIAVFGIATTCVILVLAEALNLVVFPPDILPYTMRGTVIIVCLTGLPTFTYIGWVLYSKGQLSAELQTLVNRDRLTDVATRDFFFERLSIMPDAYGVSLMVDIDHFKQVNDTHGHLAGDDVIHAVAQILRREVRSNDIVCRFGGEEFIIFLHQSDPVGGWAIAERIRTQIEKATTNTSAGDVKVTVSVGGSLKAQLEHVDAAIKRADECLYRAKAQGRNRTVVDWDETDVQAIPKAS